MTRSVTVFKLLLARDLRELGSALAITAAVAAAAEVGLWFTDFARDPMVGPVMHRLTAVLVGILFVVLACSRQGEDLSPSRTRHLLSFPITPTQVVLAKGTAFVPVCLIAVVFDYLLWLIGGAPEGSWHALVLHVRVAGTIALVLAALYGLVLLNRRVTRVLAATAVISVGIATLTGAAWVLPLSLLMVEKGSLSSNEVLLCCVMTGVWLFGSLLALNLHLRLRPIQ
jgi:hypothetical protein